MLHLNAIFDAEGLDPDNIQLVRHKDRKLQRKKGLTLFDYWYSRRNEFEQYQSIQKISSAFKIGGFVASFVVTSTDQNLFVGIYKVLDRRPATSDDVDPIWKTAMTSNQVIHTLEIADDMNDYVQRLSIETWKDAINYVKSASKINPVIREIKSSKEDELFPGYRHFARRVGNLKNVFPSWIRNLSQAKGVYLLTFDDGVQYVGSATGADGFWQRWMDYAKDGTGGNKVLIKDQRDARNATASILEVSGSAEHRSEIVSHEMIWQRKLGTRTKRLGDGNEIPPDARKWRADDRGQVRAYPLND